MVISLDENRKRKQSLHKIWQLLVFLRGLILDFPNK